jgi:hypothetical protein
MADQGGSLITWCSTSLPTATSTAASSTPRVRELLGAVAGVTATDDATPQVFFPVSSLGCWACASFTSCQWQVGFHKLIKRCSALPSPTQSSGTCK